MKRIRSSDPFQVAGWHTCNNIKQGQAKKLFRNILKLIIPEAKLTYWEMGQDIKNYLSEYFGVMFVFILVQNMV